MAEEVVELKDADETHQPYETWGSRIDETTPLESRSTPDPGEADLTCKGDVEGA
ncbi:hypothetical protein PI125_g24738 [Phytophthora idaei]|nr:hypothetical protein PI125_g24738 [Phytophthora idaei]